MSGAFIFNDIYSELKLLQETIHQKIKISGNMTFQRNLLLNKYNVM